MNRLQSLRAEREFCVTLNRTEVIDPEQMICKTPYAHPLYTPPGLRRRRDTMRSTGATGRTTAAPTGDGGSTRMALSSALRVVDELASRRMEPVRL